MAQKVIDNIKVVKQDIDTPQVMADSTLSMRMRIFDDDVDTAKATPLIEIEAFETIKGQVEGKTDDVLRENAIVTIKAKFQAEIDRYIAQQTIQNKITAKAIEDNLDVSKIPKVVK